VSVPTRRCHAKAPGTSLTRRWRTDHCEPLNKPKPNIERPRARSYDTEVAQTLGDWLQQNSDRVLARQRAQVDTAKILVSITLAVAATIVATALQVRATAELTLAACWILAAGFVATVPVVMLDRLKEPDRLYAQDRAHRGKWSDDQLLDVLHGLALDAEKENNSVVRIVQVATAVQVTVSLVCGVFAVIAVLAHTP